MVAKSAYGRMCGLVKEDTNSVTPPTPQANVAPTGGTAAATAPLSAETNPAPEGTDIPEEKYSENNESKAYKDFKKSLVGDIIAGKQVSEEIKNLFLSILLKTTGQDDDVRVARDSILKGLNDARAEIETMFDSVRTSTVL